MCSHVTGKTSLLEIFLLKSDFLRFYSYLCNVIDDFLLDLKCSTKESEKSDMTKSWSAWLCRLPQQELFVAQELIKIVKQKCCGI